MNTTGCTAPLATDQWLVAPIAFDGTSPPACDANLAGFAIWLGILTLMKMVTGVGLSFDWYMRYRTQEGRARMAKGIAMQNGKHRRNGIRYPIVPTMNLIQAILFALFLVFSATGSCSSQNGCGLAMYCSMYLLSAGYCIVLLKQFVALGRRMIPLARSKLEMMNGGMTNSSSDTGNSGTDSLDFLGKEDALLRILIWLQVLCAIIQVVFGVIVQLADSSRSQYELWLSLAFGFHAGFFFFNMLGFMLQLQRLINATKIGCAKPYHPDVLIALNKMQQTQVGFAIIELGALLMAFLIAIRVIPVRWFVILLLMSLETSGTTLTFVKFALGKLMKKSRHAKQTVPSDHKKKNGTTGDDNEATQGSMVTMGGTSVIFHGSTVGPLSGQEADLSVAVQVPDV